METPIDKIGNWFYERRPRSYIVALIILALVATVVVVGAHAANTTSTTRPSVSATSPSSTKPPETTIASTKTTKTPGPVTITGSQAWNHIGQFETVKFYVGYTYTDASGTEFLDQYVNYQNGFVVTIYATDLSAFSFDPSAACLYQTIEVSGYVSTYDNFVEILNPDSIKII